MPEYVLFDKEGKKHTYFHLVDVRTALATKEYFTEKPERKPPGRPKKVEANEPETDKKDWKSDKVKTKTIVDKMEDSIKDKKP